MSRYFAIKRTVNNDYVEHESEKYTIKDFEERSDAAAWLLEHYLKENNMIDFKIESLESLREILEGKPSWKAIYDFLMSSTKDDALFNWEWKRRGNFRSYKIVERSSETGDCVFHARAKNLFKLKNDKIAKKIRK